MGRKPGDSLWEAFSDGASPLWSGELPTRPWKPRSNVISLYYFSHQVVFICLFQDPPTQNPSEMSSVMLLVIFPAQGNPSLHPIFWIGQTPTHFSTKMCPPLQEAFSDFLRRVSSFISNELLLLHIHQSPVCHLPRWAYQDFPSLVKRWNSQHLHLGGLLAFTAFVIHSMRFLLLFYTAYLVTLPGWFESSQGQELSACLLSVPSTWHINKSAEEDSVSVLLKIELKHSSEAVIVLEQTRHSWKKKRMSSTR